MDDSDDNRLCTCLSSDVSSIIEDLLAAFKFDPRHSVTLEEMVAMFHLRFPADVEGRHEFTESEVMELMTEIGDLAADRFLSRMVKDGKLEMMHDGEQFCFRTPE